MHRGPGMQRVTEAASIGFQDGWIGCCSCTRLNFRFIGIGGSRAICASFSHIVAAGMLGVELLASEYLETLRRSEPAVETWKIEQARQALDVFARRVERWQWPRCLAICSPDSACACLAQAIDAAELRWDGQACFSLLMRT